MVMVMLSINLNSIPKYRYSEKGEVGLLVLVKMLLLIGIIGIGIDFYRIGVVKNVLEAKVTLVVQNSLEISMLDNYRREHLSKVDGEEVRDWFYRLLCEELGLDKNLRAIDGSWLGSDLIIDRLIIEEGSIDNMGNQMKYPSIKVWGYTMKKISLVSYISNRDVKVSFDIEVSNSRYDID